MKKLILSIIVLWAGFAASLKIEAQTLPSGSCGIVYTYDAAGNRTKREYVCNNSSGAILEMLAGDQKIQNDHIIQVDVLYPNPTSGKFSITFSKALRKASISLTDVNGKIIRRFYSSGNKVDFDLSSVASGIYFVTINDEGNIIRTKVEKQ